MSDTTTRSGMLWEVERILTECEEKPQILLMENVPQVHSQDNIEDFNKWQYSLEKMGYKNYWQNLIATDYGIPQTRNRCFMISILGDYNYTFPKPIPLKLKLKDMLEDNVDKKYYLSDKQIKSLESGSYNASKPSVKLEITDKGLCQTLDTMSGGNRQPLVRVGNKSLQETLEQNKIDDTCYIDTYNKRIDKEKSGTITTGVSFRNNTFVAYKTNKIDIKKKVKIRKYEVNINNLKKILKEHKKYSNKEISSKLNIPLTTVEHWFRNDKSFSIPDTKIWFKLKELLDIKTNEFDKSITTFIEKDNLYEKSNRCYFDDGLAPTLTATNSDEKIISNLRIRKLTPKECFRLMGVKDEDFDKVRKNQSDSSLYHLAGDSIVVNVLMAIFKEMV